MSKGLETEGRAIAAVTGGYISIGIVSVFDSMGDMWYPSNYGHGFVTLTALGFVLVLLGVLANSAHRAWDALLFVAGGVSAWTYSEAAQMAGTDGSGLNLSLPPGQPLSYQGWYFFFIALFYVCLLLGAPRAGRLRQLFVLIKTVQLLSAAVACWYSIAFMQPIVGWMGVAAGLVAVSIAAVAMVKFGRGQDPNSPPRHADAAE